MLRLGQWLRESCGRAFSPEDLVAVFSIRLDESGYDGKSPFAVVAGAVASVKMWEGLESRWRDLLREHGVSAYHYKEFFGRGDGEFAAWDDPKKCAFQCRQNDIIRECTLFSVSAVVHREVHKKVKERMRGIKKFTAGSDYGICFQWLLHHTAASLTRVFGDEFSKLTVLVESGPWVCGALAVHQRLQEKLNRQAGGALYQLGEFVAAPKGVRPSLEAADYLAGIAHRMVADRLTPAVHEERLHGVLGPAELEQWYSWMMEEKERRRECGRRKPPA